MRPATESGCAGLVTRSLILMGLFFSNLNLGWAQITEHQVLHIDQGTVHVYANVLPSTTILYVPGCNGLDAAGKGYQRYHINRIKEVWPEANLVVSQYVNDFTHGAPGGRCDWDGSDARLKERQSWHQAEHTIRLAEWVKKQTWSNQEVHLFAFSWGGRVGIWVPASEKGKAGVFRSVALIWPDCRPIHKIQAGKLHTPTRIWATENDPLSHAKNCPNYFQDENKLLSLFLFPGDTHSWMTGPKFVAFSRWWPQQQVWVKHEYNEAWSKQTFLDWKQWASTM